MCVLNAFLVQFSNYEEANRTDLEGYVDETFYIYIHFYIGQSGEVLVSSERYAVGDITIHKVLRTENIKLTWILVYTRFPQPMAASLRQLQEARLILRNNDVCAKNLSFVIMAIMREITYFSFFRKNGGEPFNVEKQDRHDPLGNTFKFV